MDADTPPHDTPPHDTSHDMLPVRPEGTEGAGGTPDLPVPVRPPDRVWPRPRALRPRGVIAIAVGTVRALRPDGDDVRGAGIAVGLSVLLGPLAGLLWNALAPHVLVGNSNGIVYWLSPESKTFVAQDGWFAGVTALAALVTVIVVTLAARRRGAFGAMLGLAIGGIVGALACLGTGVLVGPADVVTQANNTTAPFAAPLELRSVGFLFTWPLLAVLIHMIIMLVRSDDGRDEPPAAAGAVADPT